MEDNQKQKVASAADSMQHMVILRHPNCRQSDCRICLKDHEKLRSVLEILTGNNKVDHLGKYHLWLSKHGIEPETEWGWATVESFQEENIIKYVTDFREGHN